MSFHLKIGIACSVTRFGEISPLLQHFKSLWAILKLLFGIRQIFEPDLANLYAIRKIYIVTKGQILKIIIEGSGHIDC